MSNQIIAGILAFLLWIFPNCSFLKDQFQQRTFSWSVTANQLMNAVKGNDIADLEAMMCQNIKENTDNLPGKIGELLDAIDGEIAGFTWNNFGGFDANHGDGKILRQKGLEIRFTTAKSESYLFIITWEYYNSFQPDEMGIRAISLWNETITPTQIALIIATEGVGFWHD